MTVLKVSWGASHEHVLKGLSHSHSRLPIRHLRPALYHGVILERHHLFPRPGAACSRVPAAGRSPER